MAMARTNMLLYGKIGIGKSATGNSIIGGREFGGALKARRSKDGEIQVVDGLSVDTKLNAKEVGALHTSAAEAVEKYGPFHAIIIVLKYGTRLFQADRDILGFLKQTFGEDVVRKHGVVVVTNGDVFKADQEEAKEEEERCGITFKQWCSQQTGLFREIVQECENRIVLFNNREKNREKLEQQTKELLIKVDSIKERKYDMNDYKAALDSRNLQQLEAKEPEIQREVNEKYKKFKLELDDVEKLNKTSQYEKLEEIENDVKTYHEELNKEHTDKITDKERAEQVMRGIFQPIRMLISEIEDRKRLSEITKRNKKKEKTGGSKAPEQDLKQNSVPPKENDKKEKGQQDAGNSHTEGGDKKDGKKKKNKLKSLSCF